MKSTSTAELIADDRAYLWHPFTPMKPWCEEKDIVVIESGEREFLVDTEGRRYIDGVSSLWCNIHGHNIPELNDAVTAQLAKIAHTTLLGLANVPSIQLAKRLIGVAQAAGLKLDKVFFSDNGSTAVEVAAKLAHQYWRNQGLGGEGSQELGAGRRSRFIAFQHAYHGDTLGAVSLGGIPLFHHTFKSLTFPVDFVPAPSFRQEDIDRCLQSVEQLLIENAGAYAAIVVEPLVLGAGGMLMYPPSVLTAIRQLADRHDTLVIHDEVLTAFGRTGKMFASEHAADASGLTASPDILCLSKGLTAGYLPLGATLSTRKIFDAFYVDPNTAEGLTKTFFHGHTFTGNPLGCAVALASLDLFAKNQLLEHIGVLIPILKKTLEDAGKNAHVAAVRQCGLIGAIDLGDANGTPFPYQYRVAAAVCRRLRSHGILLRPLADTLIVMPPPAITEENFHRLCQGVLESLQWIPEILADKKRISARTT